MGSRLARLVLIVLAGFPGVAAAQLPLAASLYRVFLKDGHALPSYGDAARVGDRLIFNLPILVNEQTSLSLQLMSLPVALVDVDRTTRYADTMRAERYAATRGEADFAALTAEVTSNLDRLTTIDDRKRQLAMAEELRQRVQAWPRDHFYYRAKEVQELLTLFNDVINELRVATGTSVSLDLSSGPIAPPRETILGVPSAGESVDSALVASNTADIGDERLAILRTTLAALVASTDAPLREAVIRRLDLEVRAGESYAALVVELRRRADVAVRSGNEAAVADLQAELLKRDQQLGFRRPADVAALVEEFDGKREAARTRRLALDRLVARQSSFLDYERRIRPAYSALDGLRPVLEHIRDVKYFAYERLLTLQSRLQRMQELADSVTPPAELASVHATFMSALAMAREAGIRRQQADVTVKSQVLRESSSAAAGALLLLDRARADLLATMFPRRTE